jgi:hypothetical protein
MRELAADAVEAGAAVDDGAHQAPGVEHEHQRLVALELVLAGDEPLLAGGRLPVDGSVLVVAGVIAQALELRLAAATPRRADKRVLPLDGELR